MKTVLCYGDSNTYGYVAALGTRYPREIRWPGRLQTLLGDDFLVIEEGCNSRTTVLADPEEPWLNGESYLRPCLKSHKPLDVVIIMLGTNDLKSYFSSTAASVAEGAGRLVDITREYLVSQQSYLPRIILISPALVLKGVESVFDDTLYTEAAAAESERFADEFRKIADAKSCDFLDAAPICRISPEDCIHFTPEAHESLAKALADMLKYPKSEVRDEFI